MNEEVKQMAGYTLKAIRVMRNMSQQDAAKQLDVSPDTLRSYEQGKSFPDVPMIKKIEKLYGITYDELIFLPEEYGETVKEGT